MQNLTKIEKQVLYLKYTSLGFSSYEANGRIMDFCSFLRNLQTKLRERKIDEITINQRFKKEFEKLCQRLEGERYAS
jgi:hypothetical protein